MTDNPSRRPREDVLDDFAVETEPGRETLDHYLRLYPEHAEALIDLSRELSRAAVEYDGPLSNEDKRRIESAWEEHFAHAADAVADPLASLSVAELRDLATTLDVPRQVITAFRKRHVILSSVKLRFLARFASALNSTPDDLIRGLSMPLYSEPARSFKSDTKPVADAPVTFERVLIDAGVPDDRRADLLADE